MRSSAPRGALFGLIVAIINTCMFVNATQIGRLMLRPVMWAHRRVAAGCYGAPLRRGGRAVWVPIAAVEEAEGIRFSSEQLRLVGIGITQKAA
jgi:hypothetical protein